MVERSKKASPKKLKRITLELDENEQLYIDLKDNYLPLELYKYYEINDNSVNSFENTSIYISHPNQLNDTMEGNLKLWDFCNLFKMMKEDGREFNELKEKNNFCNEYYEKYFEYRGVFCLTKKYQNNLFWPHYTNERGFCIEFDSDIMIKSITENNVHIESKYVYPISYENLNKIDLLEHCSYKISGVYREFNSNIPSMYTIAIKDKLWEYEDEWRIIAKSNVPLKDKSFRKLKYDAKSISRIFLAEKFFSEDRFICSNEYSKVKKFTFKKEHYEYKNLLVFIDEILKKYNDKIYIIGRIEKGDIIEKDIEFQIVIKRFDIHSVEVEFKKVSY